MIPLLTLWYRRNRRKPWRPVFTGTSQECTNAMNSSGDYQTLAPGERPRPDFRDPPLPKPDDGGSLFSS